NGNKAGSFSGIFEHGDFIDKISFEIEQDSTSFKVFFTSLDQNAIRIPFQGVEVRGDSISFKLQSDFYTYSFKNKWVENNSKLQGALTVDSITVPYTLEKELPSNTRYPKNEDVSFESNELKINGTIWHPKDEGNEAIVILTSSGSSDRSASRAEAKLFAQMGFTTFHYDKRGTGNSEGDWQIATIEELVKDDMNAIKFFSDRTGISLTNIGIKGSSQGATKIPYILNELDSLEYGVVVSCPGVSLLESDLNYWKNRNAEVIGNDIEAATDFQREVFEFKAGKLSRTDLEKAIDNAKSNAWFTNVWVPNLDEVQVDKKLLYSPIPYFQRTKQPILIVQGTRDEIIPANSHEIISEALAISGNNNYKTVLLDGASHSMYKIGESDFPFWSKLHPDYLRTIEDWINTASNNVYTK
ncbi:alpha/beta hydrolase family protein, partial [Fulvivirga lutimaris]|uniref:alpha/beta hydrolase family protein n=1 Tax=Fulvivirga lutimaris TaxID=1819566 RepID=UPI0012BCA414